MKNEPAGEWKALMDADRPYSGVPPTRWAFFALQHVSSEYVPDTKIEVAQFLKDLLRHSRIIFLMEVKQLKHEKLALLSAEADPDHLSCRFIFLSDVQNTFLGD